MSDPKPYFPDDTSFAEGPWRGLVLGIPFMIPLRPFLIVQEHHNLPYPEGKASAARRHGAARSSAAAHGC